MCLGPEFFEAREAAIRLAEAGGAVELEHFLEARDLDLGLLYRWGYLETRLECPNTAEIFVHHLAPGAGRWLRQDRSLQLLFVRRKRVEDLAARLKGGTHLDPRPGR